MRSRLQFRQFNWDTVSKVAYKRQDGSQTFFRVERQNIISSDDGVDFDVRYFECGSGGYTTLEKHQHTHIVMIARGLGRVIIGENVYDAEPFDFFIIPEWQPHQLMNAGEEPFGFFCTVNARRDRFTLLSREETEKLRQHKEIMDAIKIPEGYFNESV
jgi:quercetin dioxygenase-like cupin family protein